jgi:excisionase family DNA binding protein
MDLLTTGQAAKLLGCSRQHVVDLCEQGRLPCRTVGRHRRIERRHVEAFGRYRTDQLTRDELQTLWLHRAIAGRIASDSETILARARSKAGALLERNPPSGTARNLRRWLDLLDAGPEPVMEVLTAMTAEARELRQSSPFLGVLTERERQGVLRNFRASWSEQPGAPA